MSAAAPMALPPAIIWGPRLGVSLGARPPNIARVALEFEEFRRGGTGPRPPPNPTNSGHGFGDDPLSGRITSKSPVV